MACWHEIIIKYAHKVMVKPSILERGFRTKHRSTDKDMGVDSMLMSSIDQDLQSRLKNRSKLDIIFDVLVSAVGGVKKTHIMSKANLSSEQMSFYFNSLLSQSLIGESRDMDDNPVYKTTEKGLKFIHCCAQIKSLIPSTSKTAKRAGTELLDPLVFV